MTAVEPEDAFWLSSMGYQLVRALEEARPHRPDLTDAEFGIVARQAFRTLSGHWGLAPQEILAYVDAQRPRQVRRRSPSGGPGRPRLREPELRRNLTTAVAALEAEGEDRPTRAMIAERLGIEPGTLGRWLRRFPRLHDLVPTSGRPRRIERS